MADNDKTIGAGRRRDSSGEEPHATGKSRRVSADAHATGKAKRNNADNHSTARANRNTDDAHATAKATRPADTHATGKASPRPFEQKSGAALRDRIASAGGTNNASAWPDEFILDGVKYRNEGVLSASSGEAIVFTVTNGGKKYALKLYYYDPDHRPDHRLLEKIKQLGGSGLLVNIVSHGVWDNPNREGEKNDYELMDFCEGGSLENVVLEGDEKTLKEVAVRMASAIDFLAKHGILHRDIKPANFFYADKEKTRIVLADFGISVECPEGEFVKIDEMRSPVYAAPEFYTNVPGEPAEVGVESDYFSLGVALLCLWMGKEKLTANESQLLRSKLNETLPMPKDLSAHTVSLLKALTRLKMSDRATFADIKRWAQGENLDTAGSGTVDSDFVVIFNSGKNQVAHSPSELAGFLVQDKALGKKYIYSGRVTRWLEETGRNELAVNVEEIAEDLYPSNQDAGLMAVAYLLDPAMDYVAPDGTHHTDPAEIALYSFNNYALREPEVVEPDSNLKVYFSALKLDKTLASLESFLDSEYFDDDKDLKSFLSSYYLAILLNELSFPVRDGDNGMVFVDSIDELLEVLHRNGELSGLNQILLMSKAFIAWLSYKDPALAGKIRMLHDNSSDDPESPYFNSGNAYRIVYELNPQVDLLFGTDPDADVRTYSIPQVGDYLNGRLSYYAQGKGDAQGFFNEIVHLNSSPVGDYLRARGENYMTFLSWHKFCMDCENEDNSQKAGPYDMVIGAYKSVAGFLQKGPTYHIGDRVVSHPEELRSLPKKEVRNAIGGEVRYLPAGKGEPVAWLDAWLTVFYQENPALDLSAKFTYEKETAKYIEYIAELAPDDYYAKRYNKAISQIDRAEKTLNKNDRGIKFKRNFFLIAAGIPTLIMLIASWFFDAPSVNPITGHFWSAFSVCAICSFIIFWIMFGFFGAIIPAAIAGLVFAGFAWAGFAWFPSVLYVLAGIILIIAAVVSVSALFVRKNVNDGLKITAGTFEFRQLDALHYTFRQKDDDLDSAVADLAVVQGAEDETTRENIGFAGGIWAALAWMMFIIWFNATPQLSGSHSWVGERMAVEQLQGKWALGTWTVKYTSGSTTIVCNIDSVENGKKIYGSMVIAGQAPVAAKGTLSNYQDTLPGSFRFWPEEVGEGKKTVDATYNRYQEKMEGYYFDRKGTRHQVTFVSTPDNGQKTDIPSSSPSSKSANSKKKDRGKNTEETEKATANPKNAADDKTDENNTSSGNILGVDTML